MPEKEFFINAIELVDVHGSTNIPGNYDSICDTALFSNSSWNAS